MHFLFVRSAYRSVLALVAAVLLCCIAVPARADAPVLDAPLVLPAARSRPELGTAQASARTTAQNSDNAVYIPWARQERGGLVVNPQSRQQALDFYLQHYLPSNGLPTSWTGSQAACDPGATGPSFQLVVLQRINYFRAMAGIPADIVFSEEANRVAQAAALLMSVNRQLSHSPPATWQCYSDDGAVGAGSSNLYLGVFGPDAISGYIRDPGAGNDFVGHRRWVLYPQTQIMGTGDIPPTQGFPAANALRVFDAHLSDPRPPTREEYVAWPPAGYVPYQVVFARWSFAYDQADFSAASVTMQSGGSAVPLAQSTLVNGYGENTLVWIPLGLDNGAGWPQPAADTRYTVTVHNVVVDGQSRDFTYDVIVFNPTP